MRDYTSYHNWKETHPGKETSDLWSPFRPVMKDQPLPYFHELNQWEQEEVVIAALVQEGYTAWHGDGASIIAQLIAYQSKARKEAEDKCLKNP